MTADGEYVAVLDRFEDDQAVLILEQDETAVDELVVPTTAVPAASRHQDAVFHVTVENGDLASIRYDEASTEARWERAQTRFDRLAERPPDDSDS